MAPAVALRAKMMRRILRPNRSEGPQRAGVGARWYTRSSMRFIFDAERAAQSAARVLWLAGGTLPYIKLIKLLYLADRQALIDSGYPITGARMVSMDRGPVLSEIYTCITWGDEAESAWPAPVSPPANYEVSLRGEPGWTALSPYDIEVLDGTFARFGHLSRWELVEFTHDLPEWRDPNGSALPIDARVILQEAGKSDEEIEDIAAQAEAMWSFRKLGATA